MAEFRVSWYIDIEADTPQHAAKKARAIQLNPDSEATVFDVKRRHSDTDRFGITWSWMGDTVRIDLDEDS